MLYRAQRAPDLDERIQDRPPVVRATVASCAATAASRSPRKRPARKAAHRYRTRQSHPMWKNLSVVAMRWLVNPMRVLKQLLQRKILSVPELCLEYWEMAGEASRRSCCRSRPRAVYAGGKVGRRYSHPGQGSK